MAHVHVKRTKSSGVNSSWKTSPVRNALVENEKTSRSPSSDGLRSNFKSERKLSRRLSKGAFPSTNNKEPVHPDSQRALFVDVQEMKQKIKSNITKKKYNVHDWYKETGFGQYLAKHPVFEQVGLTVISLNAVWIAIDTDYNHADVLYTADPIFQIVENTFCAFFLLEWLVRFTAFKNKLNGFKDAWFVFDGSLVLLMVLETWAMTIVLAATGIQTSQSGGFGNASVLRLVRLFRLTRMARMARLLRAVPELMILIKGMAAATRSVFFTLCLLVAVIYVFGIAFVQLTKGTAFGDKYFKTVGLSMFTLLLRGTYLDEITELMDDMREQSILLVIIFLLFVLMAAQTVTNMLIGVLCEVVSIVAATEKEEILINFVVSRLGSILSDLDYNTDQHISKKEFVMMLSNSEATKTLQEVGVDAVGLVDFADVIFAADDQESDVDLSFEEFMDIVLQFRGTNTATVKDVVESQKIIRNAINKVTSNLKRLEENYMMRGMGPNAYSGGSKRPTEKFLTRQNDINDLDLNYALHRQPSNIAASFSTQSFCASSMDTSSKPIPEASGELVKMVTKTDSMCSEGQHRGQQHLTGQRKLIKMTKNKSVSDGQGINDDKPDECAEGAPSSANLLEVLSSHMAAIHGSVVQGHATIHQIVTQHVEQEVQQHLSAERAYAQLQSQAAALQEENRVLRDLIGTLDPNGTLHLQASAAAADVLAASQRSSTASIRAVASTASAQPLQEPPEVEVKASSPSKRRHSEKPSRSQPFSAAEWRPQSAGAVVRRDGSGAVTRPTAAGTVARPHSAHVRARPESASSRQSIVSDQSIVSVDEGDVDDPLDDVEFFQAPIERIPGGMPSTERAPRAVRQRDDTQPLRETAAFAPSHNNAVHGSPPPPQTSAPSMHIEPSAREQRRRPSELS